MHPVCMFLTLLIFAACSVSTRLNSVLFVNIRFILFGRPTSSVWPALIISFQRSVKLRSITNCPPKTSSSVSYRRLSIYRLGILLPPVSTILPFYHFKEFSDKLLKVSSIHKFIWNFLHFIIFSSLAYTGRTPLTHCGQIPQDAVLRGPTKQQQPKTDQLIIISRSVIPQRSAVPLLAKSNLRIYWFPKRRSVPSFSYKFGHGSSIAQLPLQLNQLMCGLLYCRFPQTLFTTLPSLSIAKCFR